MLSKGRIKELTSVHQKKYRSARNKFLAEGDKLVLEAMRSKADIREIFALESWKGCQEAERLGIPLTLINEKELDQICELKNPKEAVAEIAMPKNVNSGRILKGKWNIYMDRLRDPGNLGTVLRIADWFGMDQVICSPDSVEGYNQKVIQASMGAIFRVPIISMEAEELIAQCKANEIPMFATAMSDKDISGVKAGNEGLLLMGNEAQGLSEILLRAADERISIKGKGSAESLNVAVAAGILMHWIYSS
jgi:RNA methyltransferase, TrmH family